jgi:membrane protein required for colicin V production
MIDYIIIGIIAFSIIVSLLRGFVREVMSLASWVVAFIVASQFYPYLATYLTQIESDYVRNGTAIGILFVLTLIKKGRHCDRSILHKKQQKENVCVN